MIRSSFFSPARSARAGRVLWKVLVFLAVLLVGLLFLAPTLAAPLVKQRIISTVEESVDARVEVGDLSLGWGRAQVSGVRLVNLGGELVARVETVDATFSILGALRGHYAADLLVDDYELHLRQTQDGRWNLQDLFPPASESQAGEGGEAGSGRGREEAPTALPDLDVTLAVSHGQVVIEAQDGTTSLRNIELDLAVDGFEEPARFSFSLDAFGGGPDEAAPTPAGRVRSEGTLRLGPELLPEQAQGSGDLVVEALSLAAFEPLLATLMPDRVFRGELDLNLQLAGKTERFDLSGTGSIQDFELTVEGDEGASPLTLKDAEPRFELTASLVPEALDLALEHLTLQSTFIEGELSGSAQGLRSWVEPAEGRSANFEKLVGDFRYRPDRLGVLLEPFLPGKLTGDGTEVIRFSLTGSAEEPSLQSLVAGAKGTATIGVGRFETTGFDASGELDVELDHGRAIVEGNLAANGGTALMNGEFDLNAALAETPTPSKTRLSFDAKEVLANSELSPLLSSLHPAFATIQGIEGGRIGGAIDCSLELDYAGTLSGETFAGGWESFPKDTISGKGSFSIRGAALEGAPVLGDMLGLLGVESLRDVNLRPIEFAIQSGRVTYSNPWTWTIDGLETTFTGSVGLDQTLQLAWNVPINKRLGKKLGLESLEGETLSLPLLGSVTRPRLDWKTAVQELARTALRNEARDLIDDKLEEELGGGLDDLLGGVLGQGGDEDPSALLTEADRLWNAGKKVEAAAIYKKIREDHKLSLVYTLNRDRIKKRGKYRGEG